MEEFINNLKKLAKDKELIKLNEVNEKGMELLSDGGLKYIVTFVGLGYFLANYNSLSYVFTEDNFDSFKFRRINKEVENER